MEEMQAPKPQRRQGRFTPAEDKTLLALVMQYGKKWELIGSRMQRSTRQVRERYLNYVNPEWKRTPWTEKEDNLLRSLFPKVGPKWSVMVKYFDGRSNVSIKNRWTCLVNKQSREGVVGNWQKERGLSAPVANQPAPTEANSEFVLSVMHDLFSDNDLFPSDFSLS